MTDLWLVALGFGVLPFAALLVYVAPQALRRHESTAWGLLVGVVAFLGLAHASATLLEGNAFLRYEANPWTAALVAAAGLLGGIALAWTVLGRSAPPGEPSIAAVLAAAVAFVTLHSFTDGLVLGEAYAGPAATGFPLTLAVLGGTLLHRFAEGALILVPAILLAWRPPKSLVLLLVGLVTVPAAYVPVAILAPATISSGAVALDQAISVLGAGFEAGFAILFVALGLLPRLRTAKDGRWALWAGIAFASMFLVHFLVE